MTSAIDLSCLSLHKSFRDFQAVQNVSFEIPRGSFFSILGPSGCGKTTLLRMLAGFLEPSSGEMKIKGRSMLGIPPNKRPVNMVFQHLALFPMMSVAENIAYGLKRRREKPDFIKRKVEDALERVGLPGIGDRDVSQLSGGQKQRIAIARCLVLEPDVLLLDEPLGALDLKLREHMKVELKKLQQAFGTTFIYITHDQSEAMVMSDQVAVMNKGRFEQVGSPQELYYHPKTPFVAGFVGENNRFSGKVSNVSVHIVQVKTDCGQTLYAQQREEQPLAEGMDVELFVRPEMIHLSRERVFADENDMTGRVENVLFDGGNSRLLVRVDGTGSEIQVVHPQTSEFTNIHAGDQLHLSWKAEQSHVFASNRKEATV
ncbi:ABC transporter ATP-binding protein [Sansalvadorimonas verongulae]|uniref:ABC transporter ATP-binding protein n=1 Tax=Sansalvadorimonas verongulae TaxID=2172824 RepID=UPI0012BD7816|nr:ABC transporter ATP-binding protein [Sansalvadorimonas verongulae]MTI14497.1 ABC transporter ATP-binding protein [Sansalvadorimonas verongulae]